MISATLPNEILEITNKFMTDPVRILVKRDELTLEVGLIFLILLLMKFLVCSLLCYSVFCDGRASSNFLLQLKKKSGSLIPCVISMIH